MEAATVTALVGASAALVASGLSIWQAQVQRQQWEKKFIDARHQAEVQRQQWEKQFMDARQKDVSDWQVQSLQELVLRRMAAYPPVFRTLGAVVDVEGDEKRLEALQQHPDQLTTTADEILGHLYGEAGLVMSMETRNQLHVARIACQGFLKDPSRERRDALVNAFFYARRQLRLDIQIADRSAIDTALKEIAKERLAEPRREQTAGPR